MTDRRLHCSAFVCGADCCSEGAFRVGTGRVALRHESPPAFSRSRNSRQHVVLFAAPSTWPRSPELNRAEGPGQLIAVYARAFIGAQARPRQSSGEFASLVASHV
jgi:hypothetical protein